MSLRIFVCDELSGLAHEYGTMPYDCLVLSDEGGLHYKDLRDGRGTKRGGYVILTDDGISEDIDGMPIVDVAGEHTGIMCAHCRNRKWYRRWRCGSCTRALRTRDRLDLDLEG